MGNWPAREQWEIADSFPTRCVFRRLPQVQLLEEIIPLVVDHDERGEVLDLDPPDRLHPKLGILHHFDLLDAVLRKVRCGAADGGEVEAAVLLAGLADLTR